MAKIAPPEHLEGIVSDRGFVYRVVSVGVDNSWGQTPLHYAQRDADAVFRTFTGALGPATADGSFRLLGAEANGAALRFLLGALTFYQTDHLLFYFSGHGGDDGIALADGIFPYEELHAALQQIPSHS